MGQPCSTSKSKNRSKSSTKYEILPKQATTCPSDTLVTRKSIIYPKCLNFRLINFKVDLDTMDMRVWQKNYMKAQKMKYVELNPRAENDDRFLRVLNAISNPGFRLHKPGFLTFVKNPSSSKYVKQTSFFFENTHKDNNINQLVDLFKYPRSINNLTLSFTDHIMIDDAAFIHLCERLKKFALLINLTLDLSKCQSLTEVAFYKLAKSLKRCVALEYLCLDLSHSGGLNDVSVNFLGRSIRRLKKLKSFSLKISGLMAGITDNFMELWRSLREKQQMRELNICCDHCWYLPNEEFEKMSQSLADLQNLQRLTLNFENCSQVDMSKALGSLGNNMKQMKNLVDFKIGLGGCRRDGEGKDLDEFLECLQTLPALKNIMVELKSRTLAPSWTIKEYEGFEGPRFYFSSNAEVRRIEMEGLARFLSKNKRFVSVVLDFEGCKKASDMRLDSLTEALKKNSMLKHIAFDFSDCWEVTDQKLIEFGQALNHNLLESVKLRFYAAGQVKSEGIEGLSKSISKLSRLKALRLDFDWCWKLGDRAVKSLAESIKGLLTLKTLRLNFSNCEGCSDEPFAKLQDSLQGLTFLENISLCFNKNENMTDKGLNRIADSLQNMKNIQTIDLNFFWCTKITQQGLDYLLDQLVACQAGKKVFLNFNMCPQIRKERLDRLKTISVFSRMETSRS